jgi:predicted DNA-binding ribbon-helix-helix protein
MHRTQISLEPEQYERIRREARRRGVSLAALMRELVEARYRSGGRSARGRTAALERVAGIGRGTGRAVGRHHNRFLYGRPRT